MCVLNELFYFTTGSGTPETTQSPIATTSGATEPPTEPPTDGPTGPPGECKDTFIQFSSKSLVATDGEFVYHGFGVSKTDCEKLCTDEDRCLSYNFGVFGQEYVSRNSMI